ncbi:conserved hypothetical protein [Ricinus communis]|uniref:Uncharacterized protein n=1 Tax=Ricinus communis TaxID=3988 RepID=B9SR87_RICCO|nr:conserved hypothetical protein [Ricinus communis]
MTIFSRETTEMQEKVVSVSRWLALPKHKGSALISHCPLRGTRQGAKSVLDTTMYHQSKITMSYS